MTNDENVDKMLRRGLFRLLVISSLTLIAAACGTLEKCNCPGGKNQVSIF